MNINKLYGENTDNFFKFVQSIRYGYKDTYGNLHFISDENFNPQKYLYEFSNPTEVVNNNCGWCWDVCQLTKEYCLHNGYKCQTWYFEYRTPSESIHQTHTQCFMKIADEWYICPDNSAPSDLYEKHSAEIMDLVKLFSKDFSEWIKKQHTQFDEKCYLVKQFDIDFTSGTSDEELMQSIRNYKEK